ERAFAGLVDDRLAWQRLQLVDDVVAILAADQDAPHRPLVADTGLEVPPRALRRRAIRQVWPVPLARVDYEHARLARRPQNPFRWRDGLSQERHVVAEGLAESA